MAELVAEKESKPGLEGTGVVGDVTHLGQALFGDADGWEVGIDTALCAIDVLSSYANPLGALISAGVGWLLEHVPGISDIWDKLMGDATAIEQIANTWDNIAKSLQETQESFAEASSEIESWQGDARESYTKVAEALASALSGESTEAEGMSVVVRLIGALCAGLKDIVYTLISEFIEFTVLPAILGAIASAWCTFGGSIGIAITYIEIQADITAEQITVKITRVTEEITMLTGRTAKVVSKLDDLRSALKELSETLEANKSWARELSIAFGHGGVEQTGGGYKNRNGAE